MNAKGKGTVYFNKASGAWVAKCPVGRREGKTLYKTKNAPSERIARQELRKLQERFQQGKLVAGPKKSFREVAQYYLENVAPNKIRESSRSKYIDDLTRHAYPTIGAMPITEVTPEDLIALFNALQTSKGLASASVNGVRKAVSGVFTYAYKNGLVLHHPVKRTEKIQPSPGEKKQVFEPWTEDECYEALMAVIGDPLDAWLQIALSTGMRGGEILGLHWADIDYSKGVLWVKYTMSETTTRLPNGAGKTMLIANPPKTPESLRAMHLSPIVLQALGRHRAFQAKKKLLAGERWRDQDLVFTNDIGGPVYRSNYRDRFETFCKRNSLRYIRPHDLRHTFAVIALDRGMDITGVSQVLGHSNINITKKEYAKYVHTMSVEVMNCVSDVLSGQTTPVERVIPTISGW